jgi:hypothetical protein
MKKPARKIDDSTPVRAGVLGEFMGVSRAQIYRYVGAGYCFEFPAAKLTTPGHFKTWLKLQPVKPKGAAQPQTPEDEARLQRELHRLRSGAGKSREPRSNRDLQTASPEPGKSLHCSPLA